MQDSFCNWFLNDSSVLLALIPGGMLFQTCMPLYSVDISYCCVLWIGGFNFPCSDILCDLGLCSFNILVWFAGASPFCNLYILSTPGYRRFSPQSKGSLQGYTLAVSWSPFLGGPGSLTAWGSHQAWVCNCSTHALMVPQWLIMNLE